MPGASKREISAPIGIASCPIGIVVTERHRDLGDGIEIRKSPWIKGFDGKSLDNPGAAGWRVKRDGGEFDQFTRTQVLGHHVATQLELLLEGVVGGLVVAGLTNLSFRSACRPGDRRAGRRPGC